MSIYEKIEEASKLLMDKDFSVAVDKKGLRVDITVNNPDLDFINSVIEEPISETDFETMKKEGVKNGVIQVGSIDEKGTLGGYLVFNYVKTGTSNYGDYAYDVSLKFFLKDTLVSSIWLFGNFYDMYENMVPVELEELAGFTFDEFVKGMTNDSGTSSNDEYMEA